MSFVIEEINKIEKPLNVYVDMDGVVAYYDIGKAFRFDLKRPLTSNINKIKEISELDGVTVNILSVCNTKEQIDEKNYWLDKYMPFIKKENRNILSKELKPGLSSSELKIEYLNSHPGNNCLIDDDNEVIHEVIKNVDNIIVFQDSILID